MRRPRIFICLTLLILFIVVVVLMFWARKRTIQASSQNSTPDILNEIRDNRTSYISSEGSFTFLGSTFGDVFISLEKKYKDVKIGKTTDSEIAITLKQRKDSYLINWLCSESDCLLQSLTENHTLHERTRALEILDKLLLE